MRAALAEGGAVGHLMHLYDNRDMSFQEMKRILTSAATGKLEKTTEKLDGLNLVFTWNATEGAIRIARAAGDIKRGGMSVEQLAAKFAGRGSLQKAFDLASRTLQGAISSLSAQDNQTIFGESGQKWYSIEVVYTGNPNVINYDSNSIVFHGWPVFEIDETGIVQPSDDASGVEILTRNIDKMQKAVTLRDWKLRGPAVVTLSKLADKSVLSEVFQRIDEAVTAAGLDDSATVGQYLAAMLQYDMETMGIPRSLRPMVIKRVMGEPGSSLVDIKKNIDKSTYETIASFVKDSHNVLKKHVRPIELAINDFAVEVLRGLKSTLVDDTDAEVQRLRAAVSSAAATIQASGDEAAMSVLKGQMEKLKSLENITTPVEGVVFIWKGNAYKFTGSFAAVNQILGLFYKK